MTLKTFEIDWKGGKETIEYEDDIAFSVMEQIIKTTVDLRELTKPRIDVATYRIQVVLAALTKAPFNIKRPDEFKKLGRKVAEKIVSGVMKDYPLVFSLGGWMTSLLGSMEVSDSPSESTPTVQSNTDGPEQKSTDKEPNGSKKMIAFTEVHMKDAIKIK